MLIGFHRVCLQEQRLIRSRPEGSAALFLSTHTTGPVALGSPSGYSVRADHRLLWPHPSLWSSAPVYGLCLHVLEPQRFPNLLHESVGIVSFPVPRRFSWLLGLFLRHECCLRRFCIGSATASPDTPVRSDQRNEAAEFTLCYDPIPLLALPRPGRLLPSFHR